MKVISPDHAKMCIRDRAKAPVFAVKRLVGKWLAGAKRKEHLRKKAFVVDVSAGSGEPILCAQVQGKEKIVHMKYVAGKECPQQCRQRGFSGCAASVDGENRFFARFQQILHLLEHREKHGEREFHYPVMGGVPFPKGFAVMDWADASRQIVLYD